MPYKKSAGIKAFSLGVGRGWGQTFYERFVQQSDTVSFIVAQNITGNKWNTATRQLKKIEENYNSSI